MYELALVVAIVIWIGIAFVCALLATAEDLEPTKWFVLGLFFTPVTLAVLLCKKYLRLRRYRKKPPFLRLDMM